MMLKSAALSGTNYGKGQSYLLTAMGRISVYGMKKLRDIMISMSAGKRILVKTLRQVLAGSGQLFLRFVLCCLKCAAFMAYGLYPLVGMHPASRK